MSDLVERIIGRLYRWRTLVLILTHVVLIALSSYFAFWLRFDGNVPPEQQAYDTEFVPLLVAIRLAVFFPMRLHQGVWRYASVLDLRNIVIGVGLSTTIFWLVMHRILDATLYPRSVFVIDSILLIFMMGGLRLSRRLYSASSRSRKARKVLIYGAGDAGESIAREMLQTERFDASPVGFIDDDPAKVGLRIHDVPVLGGREKLPQIIEQYGPQELLIAIPSASQSSLRSIVRALEPFKLRITTLPRVHELINARVEIDQIRDLKVEDLLARDPVGLDYQPVLRFLEGRRVLVTGAGGSIGSELCRQIIKARPASIALLDRYENGLFVILNELKAAAAGVAIDPIVADITDEGRIKQILERFRPEVVFHAAAHKHVPLMEENPCEAVKNNVRGTRLLAEAAIAARVERFVLISTDKAVRPTSVMGSTKRLTELMVDQLNSERSTRFVAVRFGNVLGSNGSVVPTFLDQIARGGPVTVTHPEMRRFFMLIPEAVQLVLHAAAIGNPPPLLVLDMGEPVKVVDMARDLIRLAGFVPDRDIRIQFTGTRPGEKLYEELVDDGESVHPSGVDKVLRVERATARDGDDLLAAVTHLEFLAMAGRSNETRHALRAVLSRHCEPVQVKVKP